MTRDEAIGRIRDLTGLTEADVVAMTECSYAELEQLISSYKHSGQVPNLSTWEKVSDVLAQVSHYCGIALPILQAAQLVFAL